MSSTKLSTSEKIAYLRLLQKATPRQRKALIQASDANQLHLIGECCKNFINGTYKTPLSTLRTLKRHKNTIRLLAKKNTSSAQRKKLLVQKGGFLSLLLPGAISLLGSLLGTITGSQ